MPSWWRRIRDAFNGWKAIATTAVVSGVATAAALATLSELWAAPEVASEAQALARENSRRISDVSESVQKLDRTVRIYLCTRQDLDVSTRIRLDCREFE